MANILEKYGIKEVADVTFYNIKDDGTPGTPALYLDTLKVSTIEQTAENVSARGGKGNPELIVWDYNKEINVTLEDALFSAKSMAIMFGTESKANSAVTTLYKTFMAVATDTTAVATMTIPIAGKERTLSSCQWFAPDAAATSSALESVVSGERYLVRGVLSVSDYREIKISPDSFPGNYYITGDTYARSEVTGDDEMFQFIIPKAKVLSEVTLTMEAEGDPSTFNLNLKVLRPSNGEMMKLVQYKL